VIEFMHDECQIYTIHTSMVSPGLAQAVCTIISLQSNFLADGCDELPGLAALDLSDLFSVTDSTVSL
jgi:hypothetical protein